MNIIDVICQTDHFSSFNADILLDDVADGALHKDGHSVKILVTINKGYSRAKVSALPRAELQLQQMLECSSSIFFGILSKELKGNFL